MNEVFTVKEGEHKVRLGNEVLPTAWNSHGAALAGMEVETRRREKGKKLIVQFGFKFATAEQLKGKNIVDCRVIQNPYVKGVSSELLKTQVRQSPEFMQLVALAIKRLSTEDEVYIGCTFGKHRSGAVAEEVAKHTGARLIILERV